jgi:hypothetical protein
MMHTDVHEELEQILVTARGIEYKGVDLYLLNKDELNSILELELRVRADNIERGVEKKNHFYDYAKIINPEHAAFKYTLSMKHKKKEIFDREKVKKALPAEFEIWKNKARLDLKKQIEEPDSSITDSQAIILKEALEKEIVLSQYNIEKVLADFDSFEVVISTFEQYTYYPALYYVVEATADSVSKASDTHLRKDVPNLLWFEDDRPYSELRSNDRMSRIIQTFDRFCENIYIKKR